MTPAPLEILPNLYSPQLDNRRDVLVHLPPSYQQSDRTYPVLYMHDGQNLFDPATSYAGDWRLGKVMAAAARQGVEAIVVGIPNMGPQRLAEYSPFVDPVAGGGAGDRYLDFLVETVKPAIDRRFRSRPERAHTGIAGSSMGGLLSLYGFFRRASTFGFAGVLIILWPRLDVLKGSSGASPEAFGALCGLSGAVVVALATVVLRTLVVAERTTTIVFYFSATCTIASLFTIPFGWQVPSIGIAAVLVLSGLSGGIGQILITESYRYAETSTIAPFDYTSMLFGILIGYVLFDEVPTPAVLTGGAIVIAAGLLLIWREHQLGLKQRGLPAKEPTAKR